MFRPGIGSSGGAGAMLIIKRSGGVIQTVTCVDSSICPKWPWQRGAEGAGQIQCPALKLVPKVCMYSLGLQGSYGMLALGNSPGQPLP